MAEAIIECPHCGNKAPQLVKKTLTMTEELEVWEDQTTLITHYYYMVQCKVCSGVSLYSDWELDEKVGDLKTASRLYPSRRNFDSLPKAILDSYKEAKRVEKHSPTAFAVLIRRTLEYLCKDKKAIGKNLKEQIDDLAQKGTIPDTLARMGSALRYLGNLSAHSSDIQISANDARTMDDFFAAIVEYVYIAPAKLDKLAKSLQKK